VTQAAGGEWPDRAGRVACALLAAAALAAPAVAKVRVVTTTPTLADITRQVGGDYVSVQSIMRGPENVHNVQPKPSYMIKVKRADLFVHSGLDLELWAPLLIKGARNPRLFPGQPGNVDASRGIALKEVPRPGQLSRALGDIHVFGNPHYALDPLNGIIIARTITDALKRADPKHAQQFEKNYQAYAERLRQLTERLVARMKPYAGTKIVVYHRSWPYFTDRFGLVKVGEVEPKPGISPGPQHLAACIETMKQHGAKIIIVNTYNNRKNAETVASRVGGKAVVLAQEVKALPGVDTYEQMFEYNVETLLRAFREVGIQPRGPTGSAPADATPAVAP